MTIAVNSNLSSAIQSGLQGYQRASEGVTASAQNIATRTAGGSVDSSLTSDLVNLNVNEIAAQANAKVIDTADQMIGRFIDELA